MPTKKIQKTSPALSKKNRVSGKHSRGGCGTCKIRRVKCDETKPICIRCQSFGVSCDGYERQGSLLARSRTSTPTPSGKAIAPRPLPLASISSLPPILRNGTEDEMRYFALFRDRTSFKMAPYFEDDPVRVMLLQACEIDSIARAAIAIGALDKNCQQGKDYRPTYLDQSGANMTSHHRIAVQQYARAINIMKKDVAEGKQDLRTTLLTSLVIIVFESFHGNYVLADRQVHTAVELIRNWRSKYPNAKNHPMGFSSPAPDELEDGLVQLFGRLETHTVSFKDRREPAAHRWYREEGTEIVQAMPEVFRDIPHARKYLELITRRARHWGYSIAGQTSPRPHCRQPTLEETSILDTTPADDRSVYLPLLLGSASLLNTDSLKSQQETHLAEFSNWRSSFESLLQRTPQLEQTLGACVLKLVSTSVQTALLTALANDAQTMQTLQPQMEEIIASSERVFALLHANADENVSQFSFDHAPMLPLYFVGLTCRDPDIRRRATSLLCSHRWGSGAGDG